MKDIERITRIQHALREVELDAVILRLSENLVMSFGIWPMNGLTQGLFTASDGPVALIAPSCEDQEMDRCWASDIRFFKWPRLDMDDPGSFLKGIPIPNGFTPRRRRGWESFRLTIGARLVCVLEWF